MLRRKRNRALPYSIAVYRGEHVPVYFQWWYFDAELENGYHLMMIAMPKLFGTVNDRRNEVSVQVPNFSLPVGSHQVEL